MGKYYIAYGSNLDPDRMAKRCPGAAEVGTAVLADRELVFRRSGTGFYLSLDRKKGSLVPCAVYAISSGDEAALDRYEGYPGYYRKEHEDINVEGAGVLRGCILYVLGEDRPYGVPEDSYMKICESGYRHFGFDTALLLEAKKRSAARALLEG
ncbi:MAG: gamma-glutamylcyclotransferase family protein [Anaerovoracaceae bacterium]|jgi:gamma-glutamylcyclotransferase (GGCT)/AIG2-like uncharacterized protein YtfP